jgi:ATP-dependent protease HslVU (ClpYQ) peptidase subunit
MTTIAYRDGILAGDTRVTEGRLVHPEKARKVHRLRNGCLFGAAGTSSSIAILKRALARNEKQPKAPDVDALCIMPNGDILYWCGKVWEKIDAPFVAIGSGKKFAYGALQVGATAREAVRAACKLEKHTGGPIHTVKLKETK